MPVRELIPYTIIKTGNAGGYSIGTVCYEFRGHDYGAAREDTQGMGEPWISMTLSSDGKGPYFTAPVSSLDPEPLSPYMVISQKGIK